MQMVQWYNGTIHHLPAKAMPRTARPNVIYAPSGCFASIKEMLPYSGKEAFGRMMGGIGMKYGRHREALGLNL